MKEGSVYLVIYFPTPWPAPANLELVRFANESVKIVILANPIGNLTIILNENTKDELIFNSQPIIFSKAPRGIISIIWKDNQIEFSINSILVKNSEVSTPLIIESKFPVEEKVFSWQDEKVTENCREWLNWRKHKYGNLKIEAKSGRRIKTIQEQTQELATAITTLNFFLQHLVNGNHLFLANILPILRSLLFWPDKKSNSYNQLLIRIAGLKNLPLPVYARVSISKSEIPNILNEAILHFKNNVPSIQKIYQSQKLMDLQEWLHSEVIIQRPTSTPSSEIDIYRIKDLIFDAANTLGTAHYDDDIPKKLDLLKKKISFERELFIDFIVNVLYPTKISVW